MVFTFISYSKIIFLSVRDIIIVILSITKLIRFYHDCNAFFVFHFRYTKTVVDSSLNAQRYNPEFTIMTSSTPATYSSNTNTSALIDQLRHINQVSTWSRNTSLRVLSVFLSLGLNHAAIFIRSSIQTPCDEQQAADSRRRGVCDDWSLRAKVIFSLFRNLWWSEKFLSRALIQILYV